MKRLILVGLVVAALLTAVVVPQGAWADDGKSGREKHLVKDLLASLLDIPGVKDGDEYPDYPPGGACFIATAAYGTPTTEEIDILRQFRDDFLLQHPAGKTFVALYYELSPPIAEFISEHEVVRAVVRIGFVDPAVAVVESTQGWWAE